LLLQRLLGPLDEGMPFLPVEGRQAEDQIVQLLIGYFDFGCELLEALQ
jgi:hypothetical protein